MNTSLQAAVIIALSATGATLQWRSHPEPSKPTPVACDPAAIPANEICLATVVERGDDGLIWIDARSAGEWKADGLPGSIHLTTVKGENFDDLLAEAGPRLQEAKWAVVYCGSTSCGISKEVVNRLTEYGMVPGLISEAKALHGGYDALKSAGMIIKGPSSKP